MLGAVRPCETVMRKVHVNMSVCEPLHCISPIHQLRAAFLGAFHPGTLSLVPATGELLPQRILQYGVQIPGVQAEAITIHSR